jgi:hypothetical protein
MRKVPDCWSLVRNGDVLMDAARDRIFQVEEMEYEQGYFSRITVTVRNVISRAKTCWTVSTDKQLKDSGLTWIGESA